MQRIRLSKAASHLYHRNQYPAVQAEIWAVLKQTGLHQKTIINHQFTAETSVIIADVLRAVERIDKTKK